MVGEQQLQQMGHSNCVHRGHNNVTEVGIRNNGELRCRVQPLLPAHLKDMGGMKGLEGAVASIPYGKRKIISAVFFLSKLPV